jgi:hypothetical protein
MTEEPMTVPQSTSDVTQWETLAAPQDDIHGYLMGEIASATTKYGAGAIECHSSQYGFTDADVEAAFEQLATNPASRFLFDKTQAAGTYEAPLITKFRAKVLPTQIAVGTSSVAGQILHTKAVALLYPDSTGWTMSGSWNISASAQEQFNIDDFIRSRSRAELFVSRIDAMFSWVTAHEKQP